MTNIAALARPRLDDPPRLDDRDLAAVDAWWRAAMYLTVGQIYQGTATTPRGAQALHAWCQGKLAEHRAHVLEHMEDLPELRSWTVSG